MSNIDPAHLRFQSLSDGRRFALTGLRLVDLMLRIHRELEVEGVVVFALIGRIQSEDTVELRKLIRAEMQKVVLDLREVKLVDRAAVGFLSECEATGVELRNPSRYIREWIGREAGTRREPPEESG